MSALERAGSLALAAGAAVRELARSRALRPLPPRRLAAALFAARGGTSLATGSAISAARDPDGLALADDMGTLTYAELDRRARSIAGGLRDEHELEGGAAVAVMCRNGRGFVEATIAASHLGADLLLLNTDFPGAQLAQVLEREPVAIAVLDDEFEPVFDAAEYDGPRVIAAAEEGESDLDRLAGAGLTPPSGTREQGRVVVLSSGTTGTPKGAPRHVSAAAALGPMSTLIERLRLRSTEPIVVCPPLFHGFGLAFYSLALVLGCPLVVRRRFDPAATLEAIAEHRAATVVAVPVMLQRILDLGPEAREEYDLGSLRAACSAAAPLSPELATRFMDAFGDILFNLYGSTETGFASLATPQELRDAPGTVGRPPRATTIRILDSDRQEVPQGAVGGLFLGSGLAFEGYSGGGSRETVDGLMNIGDLGHFDEHGLLHIDGREDDMIVSGGENVFPQEVADALGTHEAVADAAVFGVSDDEFGQRLRAYVVPVASRQPGEEELTEHLRGQLARYKLPRDYVFVDGIPRNPTGKVLRRQLEREAAGA